MKPDTSKIRAISCFAIMILCCSLMNLSAPATPASDQHADPDILHLIQQVDETALQSYVQHIQDFGPHPTGSPACDQLAEYLQETLASFHLTVSSVRWHDKLRSGMNIQATLPGATDNIIVVSAHYDSAAVSPGADDDGSGVSVVLAAASILRNYSFNSTVRFVLFSGEEQGLLGSQQYVKHAYQSGEPIIGDLNLDGIGYAVTAQDGSIIKDHTDNQSAWMADLSQAVASQYHDEIGLEVLHLPQVTFSDHESFVQYGYDASYLFEYALSPNYHTSEDTLENMNITYLAKVCRLTVGTLASMAALHPVFTNKDIGISIRGELLAHPSQFCVRVDNEKPETGTMNVSVNIAMRNLRTGEFVYVTIGSQRIDCNWTFMKEIQTSWEFKTTERVYPNQLVSLEVTVKGINDDATLYAMQRTVGVIIHRLILLIPKG